MFPLARHTSGLFRPVRCILFPEDPDKQDKGRLLFGFQDEYVLVSKSDLVPATRVDEICQLLHALPISVDNETTLKKVRAILDKITKEKQA